MIRPLVPLAITIGLLTWPAHAIDTEAEGYKLLSGNSLTLTPTHSPSNCRVVTNNSGVSQFIATKTATEWSSFIANPPTNVAADGCGGASPSVVQTATATSGTGGTTALNLGFGSNCTVGNTVIVGVMGRLSSDYVTSMTGMGATWTKAHNGSQSASNIEIWRGSCVSAGSLVTITNNTTNIQVRVGLEVANLGTIADGTSSVVTTGGWAPNVSVTTSNSPGLVFVGMSVDKQATFSSASNSFSEVATIDAGTGGSRVSGSAAYFITSAAGTYSTTLTVSGTGSPTSTAVGVGFR